MIRPPAIDWPRLLGGELPGTTAREPAPLGTLAADLGVPRSILRGWLEGAEPRHNDGEALLMRWCALTGKARVFAPLVRRGGNPTQQVRRARSQEGVARVRGPSQGLRSSMTVSGVFTSLGRCSSGSPLARHMNWISERG